MKALRQIELFLDGTYPKDDGKRFLVGARCICNYVERAMATQNFESPYSRINIFCSREASSSRVAPYKHEPFLEVHIPFDAKPLDSLSLEEIQRQFSAVIQSGLRTANAFTPMPIEVCDKALADFESGGFINRWSHLDKRWSRWKCRSVIAVEVAIDCFTADQFVYVDGSFVAERRVAQTIPREGIFIDYLGQLTISSLAVLEYKKKGRVLSAFDLQQRAFLELPVAAQRDA